MKITSIFNIRRYYVAHFWGKITKWVQAKKTSVDETPRELCQWP